MNSSGREDVLPPPCECTHSSICLPCVRAQMDEPSNEDYDEGVLP